MKPDAILINTARGGLIDENALLDALEAGRLCGAGIDAFSSEPPKDPRWFTLDNVVLGSHCAASTAGASQHGAHGYCQPHPRSGPVGREDSDEIHTGPRSGHLRQQGNPVQRRGKMITSEVFRTTATTSTPTGPSRILRISGRPSASPAATLIDKGPHDPGDIAAASFSGQMMGCLCVDKQGQPLRPSIIWADQRAQAQAAALGEQISLRDFYHIAGHRNSASYGLQKLMWVRDNEPEVYAKTYRSSTPGTSSSCA